MNNKCWSDLACFVMSCHHFILSFWYSLSCLTIVHEEEEVYFFSHYVGHNNDHDRMGGKVRAVLCQ